MEILFLILILVAVLGWVGAFLGSRQFRSFVSNFVPSTSLSDFNSPVGEKVILGQAVTVFDKPGGNVIGNQPVGASGVVVSGPVMQNGMRYWQVDFATGVDGWVPETALRNANGGAFDPGDTRVGLRISVAGDTNVYGSPGGSVIGAHEKGALGTIAGGPVFANGSRYWYVDFDTGVDGWVKESALANENGSAFYPGKTPIGSRVYSAADPAGVRDAPGGVRIGGQERGKSGTIIGGPVFADGKRYWQVDFDTGVDGWVSEDELALPPRETLFSKLVSFFRNLYKSIAMVFSLIFIAGIIYCVIRLSQVGAEMSMSEKALEKPRSVEAAHQEFVNRRWQQVVSHAESENPGDWRMAIIEADIILDEILARMGYHGDTVGDKLKGVEVSDFNTLEDAWEAHKVRNIIAHKGSDFVLSRRETQRVVSLYANVFREFRYLGHASDLPHFEQRG